VGKVMGELGLELFDSQINNMLSSLDLQNSGKIPYQQFLDYYLSGRQGPTAPLKNLLYQKLGGTRLQKQFTALVE